MSPRKKILLTLPLLLILVGVGIFFFTKPTHGVNRTWDGGGGNSGWDTDANWSGDTEPGSGDVAVFDSSCVSNCSPTIDKNVNVGGIDMDSTYGGTITQTSTYTVTVGTSGWVHDGGTFTANGRDISIGSGGYTQTGGTFNASSSTITVTGNWTETSGVWNAQTSTLKFSATNTITPGSVSYYNVEFTTGGSVAEHTFTDNMTVTHNLTKSGGTNTTLSGGYTIYVVGNLDVSSSGDFNSISTTTITINGTGSQTLSSTSGGDWVDLIINKPSGILTLLGTVPVAGDWIWTQGTLDAGTSTLKFSVNNTITPGSVSYYNVEFTTGGSVAEHTFTDNMTVTHNLTKSGGTNTTLSGGYTIYVVGNLDVSSSGDFNPITTTITINGTGPQTLSSTGGGGWATLIVNKPNGEVTLGTSITTQSQPLTITSGLLIVPDPYSLSMGALTVGASGHLRMSGTGDLTLAGDVSNSGEISLRSTMCGGDDYILIRSSNTSSRSWSGGGTFNLYDVDVSRQTGTITAYSSTNSGNTNWTFSGASCPQLPSTLKVGSGNLKVGSGNLTVE